MNSFDSFFSLIIVAAGIYSIYAAQNLKVHRIINKTLQKTPTRSGEPRDLDGFIDYLYPRGLAFGFATLILGGWNLLSKYVQALQIPTVYLTLEITTTVAFFGVLIYYSRCLKKAEKMYY